MTNPFSSFQGVLFVLLISILAQHRGQAQQAPSPDLEYLDSLIRVGIYKEALRGFQQQIQELEESDNTFSQEYVYCIRQAIYCQVRLPDFAKAGEIVQKVLPNLNQYKHLPTSELAPLYLAIGEYDYLVSGKFDRALKYIRSGYEILENSKGSSNRLASAATYLGALFTNRTEYDSSLHYLDKALKLHIENHGPKHYLVAGIYSQMSQNYLQSAQYWKSLSSLKKMLTISIAEIDSTVVQESLYLEGDSLERFFTDFISLSIEQKIPHQFHPIDAEVGRVMAMAFFKLGDLQKAHDIALIFQEVYEQNKSPYLVADCQNIIGNIYTSRYQYEYALSLYRQAKNTYIRLGLANAHVTVWTYENLAQTHSKLLNQDSATYYERKALAIKKKSFESDNSQIARSYFNLADSFDFSIDTDSALFYLNKAIKFGFVDEGFPWYKKGVAFLHIDKLDSAKIAFDLALAKLDGLKSEIALGTLNGLGDTFTRLGNLDSAYQYYDQALINGYPDLKNVISGNLGFDIDKINHPTPLLSSLSKIISLHLLQFEHKEDISLLKKAQIFGRISERLISQVRGSFIMESDHLRFSERISSVIKNTIEVNIKLYEQSGNEQFLMEAFRIADLNKSQVLLEALRSTIIEQKNNYSVVNKWSQLRNSLRTQRAKLWEKTVSSASSVTDDVQDKRYLEKLENDYALLLKSIKETQPGLFYYVSDNSSDFSTVSFQKHLKKTNSVAVQYFLSGDYLYQFWLTGEDIKYSKTSLKDTLLSEIATGFHEFVSKSSTSSSQGHTDYVKSAHFLFTVLLPFLNEEDVDKRLILIPDNYLSSIPFEALLTKEVNSKKVNFATLPYLIKERAISYAFSASVLSETIKHNTEQDNLVATGWAPFSDEANLDELQKSTLRDKSLSKLVGASLEIQGIKKQFNGENFISKNASESIFREKAESSRILHIATHGVVNEESPELSYLVFNKAEGDSLNDGDLHLFELYDMSLNADLTILSACNTGNGKLASGEGVMSMARAFTYSGSKSVMMSLWLANDKSTYEIIDNFYEQIADSETKSGALQKSKLTYLNSADNLRSHPFYWAHIITTGNNEPLIERPGIFKIWWLLLLLPLIFISLYYRRQRLQYRQS